MKQTTDWWLAVGSVALLMLALIVREQGVVSLAYIAMTCAWIAKGRADQ